MDRKLTSPEKVGMSAQRLGRIRPAMQKYLDNGMLRGMTTMVARKGEVVHFEQQGHRDKEGGKLMTADTIFRIYSMTKPIAAVALMMLYEHGIFQLNDPVAKFIPAFAKLKVFDQLDGDQVHTVDLESHVTMSQLLTHTAGFTYGFLDDSPVAGLYRQNKLLNDADISLEEFVDKLLQFPLAYQPGSIWHYSVSIDVVARLVEVISGQLFGDYLQEKLFDPLGMVDTGFGVSPDKLDRLSAMYGLPDVAGEGNSMQNIFKAWEEGFNDRIDVSETYPVDKPATFMRGGHGLFSTTWDYMRFCQMVLNGGRLNGHQILSRKTIELMYSNFLPADLLPWKVADPPDYGYGYGLGSRVMMDPAEAQTLGSVGEHGWAGAAKTYFWIDPAEEMAGVFMSQSMMYPEPVQLVFRNLAYSAIVD